MTKRNNVEEDKKFIGGISLFKHRPVFNENGEYIVQSAGNNVSSYFCKTGRMIKYTGVDNAIVGFDVYSYKNIEYVIACSCSGELATWNLKSGLLTKKINVIKSDIIKFKISFVNQTKEIKAVICWNGDDSVHSGILNVRTGQILEEFQTINKSKASNIAVGGFGNSSYLVSYLNNHLYALKLQPESKTSRMKISQRYFTALACHPDIECILTGDNTGRVLLWPSIEKKIYTVYHWHTLPVKALCFSSSGTFFFSGGSECVLVKWSIKDTNDKSFLPRLPAPIVQISISSSSDCLAICTEDNAIHITDMQFNVLNIIQEFSVGTALDPTLVLNSAEKTLIVNGSTGRLLFYNPIRNQFMFNLDVVGMNKLTQERETQINNVEVRKFTVDKNMFWLATLEEYNGNLLQESRLKFWINNNASFQLSTNVDSPHDGQILDMQFQPSSLNTNFYFVTIGTDKFFKLWKSSSENSKISWRCDTSGYYKSLSPTCVSFSADGSILAISFENLLTIWDPTTCSLKATLKHPLHQENITKICFGTNDQCHLAVVSTENYIGVWNLLSLSLVYLATFKTKFLLSDNISNYLAAVSTTNKFILFELPSMEPILIRNLSVSPKQSILSAAIMKRDDSDQSARSSCFYYVNSDKELLAIELENSVRGDEYCNPMLDDSDNNHNIFKLLNSRSNTKANKSVGVVSLYKTSKKKSFNVLEFIIHSMVPVRHLTYVTLQSFLDMNQKSSATSSVTQNFENIPSTENVASEKPHISEKSLKSLQKESIEWTSLLSDL